MGLDIIQWLSDLRCLIYNLIFQRDECSAYLRDQADRHCVCCCGDRRRCCRCPRRRRDIPRKIVRVLWESQFPDNFTPDYISEFSLNSGREGEGGDDRASASSYRISSLLFPPFARNNDFRTLQPRRFRIVHCLIRSRISSPVAVS